MKRIVSFISSLAMFVSLVPLNAHAQTLTPISQIQSGDLVRGQAFPAVYYMGKDGFRYVFPNDRTYFTWFGNFDSVKWISDADLGTIQIGGNVTYKPGVKMIKIDTDPKTYAIAKGGTLRWVTSEQLAVELYGANWNKMIDDMPDGFFPNYKRGDDIDQSGDYDPTAERAAATNINDDKDLKAPFYIDIQDFQYDPTTVTVPANRAIRWTNRGATKHTATANDLSWGTGTLNPGEHFSRYFRQEGIYDYFCSYHPDTMKGQLIVTP